MRTTKPQPTSTEPAPPRRPRHLRLAPATPPPARCPACRAVLDEWECEIARAERRPLECGACRAVLV